MEAEPPVWYKYADVADTDEVVRAVRARHPGCHVCAVGFSAGSNTLTKYLCEVGSDGAITAAVSAANAFNLSQCKLGRVAWSWDACLDNNVARCRVRRVR